MSVGRARRSRGGAASSSSTSAAASTTSGALLSSYLYTHGQQSRHQLVVRVVVTALCVLIVGMCVVFVVLTFVPRRNDGWNIRARERYGMVTTWDSGGSGSTMQGTHNKREYYYSFEAYKSFEEAQEDMSRSGRREEEKRNRKSTVGGDSDDDDESKYGAVHLCVTEDARRSSFPSYIVIPRHVMYYSDRDVKAWESGDARRFTERKQALESDDEDAAEKFKYSLSAIGKNNLKRYGGFGGHLKLTIFEVEVCSRARCPTASGIAILGVLESHATQMARAKDNEWTAYNSPMANKLSGKIECRFHDIDGDRDNVVYRVPAKVESAAYKDRFMKIFCELPPLEEVLSGSHDLIHGPRFLYSAERFGISIAEVDDGEKALVVHGNDVLDVCRLERTRRRRRARNGSGPAICLRPLSLHKLFDPENTIEASHLIAWLDFHIEVAGAKHVYLEDRWGNIIDTMASEDPESYRALMAYIDRDLLSMISFPYFSEMQTNKQTSNMRYLSTYDQVVAYELCLMHARQMGDLFLMPLDSDEWFRTWKSLDHGEVSVSGGTAPVPLETAISTLLRARDVHANEVDEIKIARFDMHRRTDVDEYGNVRNIAEDVSLWPVEAYDLRSQTYHKMPRSTLNPWNAGVMNIHANEPIARTPLVPDPPRGQRVALWDEPDAYISISHYTCSQVLAWPHSQSCPCPDSVTCVYDDFFVHTRALLAHEM